jgi:hypothetical protein
MRSYLTGLTVEEEVGGNVVSHELQFIFHPILRWGVTVSVSITSESCSSQIST